MINGFEKETHSLTEKELQLVPLFVAGLITKIGKENAITNPAMVKAMEARGHKIGEPRVRQIIHYIRVYGLVNNLVGTSRGYYVENDPEKLAVYVESLNQRIRSLEEVRDSFTGQLEKL